MAPFPNNTFPVSARELPTDEVVAVDDLLVGGVAEEGADVGGLFAGDSGDVGRRVVGQAAGDEFSVCAGDADYIAAFEFPFNTLDAGGQEGAALPGQRGDGA